MALSNKELAELRRQVRQASVPTTDDKSYTHWERLEDGHYVRIQHCIYCDKYLGVNYPSDSCPEHKDGL